MDNIRITKAVAALFTLTFLCLIIVIWFFPKFHRNYLLSSYNEAAIAWRMSLPAKILLTALAVILIIFSSTPFWLRRK